MMIQLHLVGYIHNYITMHGFMNVNSISLPVSASQPRLPLPSFIKNSFLIRQIKFVSEIQKWNNGQTKLYSTEFNLIIFHAVLTQVNEMINYFCVRTVHLVYSFYFNQQCTI